jgi:calcineurin-like phosphoesterase family protein
MENIYLVEIRLARTQWKIKQTIVSLAALVGVGDFIEQHPHVTLFGPFTLKEGIAPRQLTHHIGRIAASYDPVRFTIGRGEHREGLHGGVIAFSVAPSAALRDLTRSIAGALSPLSDSYNHWDGQPEKKWFHVTIANRLDKQKAASIYAMLDAVQVCNSGRLWGRPGFFQRVRFRVHCLWHGLTGATFRPRLFDEAGLRITVMCGQEIMAEYDILSKKWISGDELRDIRSWQDTLAAYRRWAGFELEPGGSGELSPGNIFLVADLHLGHANIIRYCSRPFLMSDVREMDEVLINNWNYTVSPESRVYFLGDLRYGRNAQPAAEYLRRLNGRITGIAGNHDTEVPGWEKRAILTFGGIDFLLVHDPANAPKDFAGWVIHGHHHNNNLRDYPFISFSERRINVSAEVIGYVPVSLQEICRVIWEHEGNGKRDPVLLRYPYVPEQPLQPNR